MLEPGNARFVHVLRMRSSNKGAAATNYRAERSASISPVQGAVRRIVEG